MKKISKTTAFFIKHKDREEFFFYQRHTSHTGTYKTAIWVDDPFSATKFISILQIAFDTRHTEDVLNGVYVPVTITEEVEFIT